jgi:RNA polymerase sigma factor (TIGR02999 family)
VTDVTQLLEAIGRHDPRAADKLLPLVYDELRRMARAKMAVEKAGHTLQATALVHEAYLRLLGSNNVAGTAADNDGGNNVPAFDGRRHFFAAAAEAMRRILVEHARQKRSLKRGGDRERVPLDDADGERDFPAITSPCDDMPDLLALNDALDRLAAEDPGKAELVKLLFFAGLPLEQAGAALGLSKTTAHRQWLYARAWLLVAMERGGS